MNESYIIITLTKINPLASYILLSTMNESYIIITLTKINPLASYILLSTMNESYIIITLTKINPLASYIQKNPLYYWSEKKIFPEITMDMSKKLEELFSDNIYLNCFGST